MRAKIPYGRFLSVLAGLGFAFWAGRASGPGNTPGLTAGGRPDARAAGRTPGRQAEPGGNGQGVTSVLQLHAIFKNSGGNWQTGGAVADAALAKMNGPQLAQLVHDLATAQATTPGYSYGREINAACVRWAEIDPDAALQFVLSNKQASFRSTAIASLMAGIARNDPALALAKLAAIGDPSLRRAAQLSVLSTLAVASPDAWVAAVKADPSVVRQSGGYGSFAAEWAMDDPAAAARRVMQLPAEMQRSGVLAIAKVWADKD